MPEPTTKTCKACGRTFPLNRDFFGQFKNKRNGESVIGFRNQCRTCMAANTRRHDQENPEQVRERLNRRKSQEATVSNDINHARIKELQSLLKHTCRYCGGPLGSDHELDHLTPIARGGTNADGNLTLCCLKCNRAKGSKTLAEYEAWRLERNLPIRKIRVKGERPDKPNTNEIRRKY